MPGLKALRRAEIENFRWHDLRHTWASWHVQNGTSLQELQQLGGWSSFEMVFALRTSFRGSFANGSNRIPAVRVTKMKDKKGMV